MPDHNLTYETGAMSVVSSVLGLPDVPLPLTKADKQYHAEIRVKREKERAQLEKNKEQITKQYGQDAYWQLRTRVELPPQMRALVSPLPYENVLK
jgi:hypothetical protein